MNAKIASILNNLPLDVYAEPAYEMFSGGLVWSDELPHPNVLKRLTAAESTELWHDILRFAFAYRTSVIRETYFCESTVVNDLIRVAPRWPGFTPARWSTSLSSLVHQLEQRSLAELDIVDSAIVRYGLKSAVRHFEQLGLNGVAEDK